MHRLIYFSEKFWFQWLQIPDMIRIWLWQHWKSNKLADVCLRIGYKYSMCLYARTYRHMPRFHAQRPIALTSRSPMMSHNRTLMTTDPQTCLQTTTPLADNTDARWNQSSSVLHCRYALKRESLLILLQKVSMTLYVKWKKAVWWFDRVSTKMLI